jgi:Ca-activated chloride channel homolog
MKRLLFIIIPLLITVMAFHKNNSIAISGKVTDNTNAPLPGVTVQAKGTHIATTTAADGTYTITVENTTITLQFSAIGFTSKEIKINGKTIINVKLEPTAQHLEEVVVMGYSMVKKKDITGSVSYIQSVPNQNVLSGKVAGAQVRIRGIATSNNQQGMFSNDDFDTESYDHITENSFHKVTDDPLSTFSIDVDAASYSNIRRFINDGKLPPAGAVRIEEMINYFKYQYPQPINEEPFSINTEIAAAPWNADHKLVLIGMQGKKIPVENLPASNIVFLIDVSGSMQQPNKIGLVKASMKLLVDQLRPQDKVAMVVYAGAAGLVLPATGGDKKIKIKEAIDALEAGGSTAGGAGIRLAYETAKNNFIKNGNNRVVLCTDGDFNTGESSDDAMERLIEQERKSGVFLTVLGYGMGNYKDSKMQKLADKGNGNHAYIDGMSEAKKVLVSEFGGTLFTIAKDVKLQVEFNPAKVQAYRLIGYENRMLVKEDFNDDKKDAGELGSGHTVTALYEVIPVGVKSEFLKKVDTLKYQDNLTAFSKSVQTDELLTVKFRYKKPDAGESKLLEYPVKENQFSTDASSDNFRFAAAVAEFGMLLRNSEFKSKASFNNVLTLARRSKGTDEEGYRSEFIELVKNVQLLVEEKEQPDEDEGGK